MSTPAQVPGLVPGFPFPAAAPPNIGAVIPGFGPASGGNPVLILGSGLNTVTSVTFDTSAATVIAQDPLGLLLVVTAPAHAPGSVPVVVNGPSGPSAAATYTYLAAPAPVVFSLTPISGPAGGGTVFTITGSNLAGATVTFNGLPATGVVVNAFGTVITGVTPTGSGAATVVVTTPTGSTTVSGGFTFL